MYTIKPVLCILCDACRPACPRNAISVHKIAKTYVVDADQCNSCSNMGAVRCVPHCPVDAIVKS